MSSLNSNEKSIIESVLAEEGVAPDAVMRIVRKLGVRMPERSVSVSQNIDTIPAGTTVVGYTARRIG